MLQESISDSAEFSGIAVSMKIFCDPSTVTVEKELLALTYGLDNNHLKIFLAFASPCTLCSSRHKHGTDFRSNRGIVAPRMADIDWVDAFGIYNSFTVQCYANLSIKTQM